MKIASHGRSKTWCKVMKCGCFCVSWSICSSLRACWRFLLLMILAANNWSFDPIFKHFLTKENRPLKQKSKSIVMLSFVDRKLKKSNEPVQIFTYRVDRIEWNSRIVLAELARYFRLNHAACWRWCQRQDWIYARRILKLKQKETREEKEERKWNVSKKFFVPNTIFERTYTKPMTSTVICLTSTHIV